MDDVQNKNMVKMAALKTENLTLGYSVKGGRHTVLTGVSLEARSGDLIGLAGLNGAGKSTLLRALAGLLQPLDGKIFIGGDNIALSDVNERAKKVAIVLTGKITGFNVTVADAVGMGLMPYTDAFHRMKNKHRLLVSSILDKTGLTAFAGRRLSELSDGLYQKTMIAKSLAQQTPVLLLDEPLAFLDFGSKHEFLKLLSELCAADGKCVMLSTHDLDLLKRYCNKTIIVADGSARLFETSVAVQHPDFLRMGGGYL
jgi:iron complex transport system ATP-binding protein